jgi:hypothetical protein
MYHDGRGVRLNRVFAAQLGIRRCKIEPDDACRMHQAGLLEVTNRAAAIEIYEALCAKGTPYACLFAFRQLNNSNTLAEKFRALSILQDQCNDGAFAFCETKALISAALPTGSNRNRIRDIPNAVKYAKKGCAGGYAQSCNLLVKIAKYVPDSKIDGEEVLGWLSSACFGRNMRLAGKACLAASDLEKAGWIGHSLRLNFLHRACAIGNRSGCFWAERVAANPPGTFNK